MDTPDEIADAFLDAGVGCVVLKLGGKGCLVKNRCERYAVPAYRHAQCVDTTGAGDAFCAGVVSGLTYGKTLAEAVEIGSTLAASVITSSENVCPRFEPAELGINFPG